ncbi:MAG: rhodanese-like domain-containing protein [Dehalococcoidia bacterium]|nr:rhodanese-like domain-containing protein [Dehalococcoidia bacterium]
MKPRFSRKWASVLSIVMIGAVLAGCGGKAVSTSTATTTGVSPTGTALQGYVHPELLVETDWLSQHLNDTNIRIVDARKPGDYQGGHIQGSVNLNTMDSKGSMYDQTDPVQWRVLSKAQAEDVFGNLGITDSTIVVAVGDTNMLWAARLFWTLEYYGHGGGKSRVLNGGITKWKAENKQLVSDVPSIKAAAFVATPQPNLIATKQQVLEVVNGKATAFILATIPLDEFNGGNKSSAARGGHIPGAQQLDWPQDLTGDPAVFKSAAELQKTFASIGFTKDKNGIVY